MPNESSGGAGKVITWAQLLGFEDIFYGNLQKNEISAFNDHSKFQIQIFQDRQKFDMTLAIE